MITLVLTYRNRDLRIVKNCLDSLAEQSVKEFKVILVDYGSEPSLAKDIIELVKNYPFIKLISCPVSGQLWNKCRAINIALKQTETPYFMVGDIDLIFHPDFIKIANSLTSPDSVNYFLYGFLSEKESLLSKKFEDFEVDFPGNAEVTGATIFPVSQLKSINGFDEFYHGWGAEDTDMHVRMQNLGLEVIFHDNEILVKHQWHPKTYRSKNSTSPFHSKLEKINSSYFQSTKKNKITKANLNTDWGKMPVISEYQKLSNKPEVEIEIQSVDIHFAGLLAQFKNFSDKLLSIKITEPFVQQIKKEHLKKVLGKKYVNYLNLEDINNLLLEEIIKNYRNLPYTYTFNRQKREIQLVIQF